MSYGRTGSGYAAIPTQTKRSSSDACWGDVPLAMSRGCVRRASKNYGRLLSHAELNYSGCCATFDPGGSLKGSRTFLANGRNKHFAIIATGLRAVGPLFGPLASRIP